MKTLRKEPIELVEVDNYVPEVLEPNKLYYSTKYHIAVHSCLCGCGQRTVTPIEEGSWQITRYDKLSMTPSILQGLGCRSHYIITNGVANFV